VEPIPSQGPGSFQLYSSLTSGYCQKFMSGLRNSGLGQRWTLASQASCLLVGTKPKKASLQRPFRHEAEQRADTHRQDNWSTSSLALRILSTFSSPGCQVTGGQVCTLSWALLSPFKVAPWKMRCRPQGAGRRQVFGREWSWLVPVSGFIARHAGTRILEFRKPKA
jgi:hypothetical protein